MFVKKLNGYYVARLSFYTRVTTKDMKRFSIIVQRQAKSGGSFVRNYRDSLEDLSEQEVIEALNSEDMRCKKLPIFEKVEPEFYLKKLKQGVYAGSFKAIDMKLSKGKLEINNVVFPIKPSGDVESKIQSSLEAFAPNVDGARDLIKIFEKGLVGWH